MKQDQRLEWFYARHRFRAAPPLATTAVALLSRLPRFRSEAWVRYGIDLTRPIPATPEVTLTPVDAHVMELLRLHPERGEHQVRSAFRFWQAGFGDGFVWMEGGEPLCMIWLVAPQHAAARAGLGTWAGMYPPLAPGVGVAEGLYTFRRGLRRRGGAATPMAHALFAHARAVGFGELRTHIHQENLPAQRWAARVGWRPMGRIRRCFLDLPLFRREPFYLHELAPAEARVNERSTASPSSACCPPGD